MSNVGIDVVIGVPYTAAYLLNTVQPGHAWAVTFAPSVSTTQVQNNTITSVVADTQLTTNVPSIETTGQIGITVNAVTGTASLSSLPPSVSTTKTTNITSFVASVQAIAGIPSISTSTVVNNSVTSVTAATSASAGIPAVSATSGGGTTTYLIIDGVDDLLRSPSLLFTEVIMDFSVEYLVATPTIYFGTTAGGGPAIYRFNNQDQNSAPVTSVYVNGVQKTLPADVIPFNTRCTLRVLSSSFTDVLNFLSIDTSSYKGKIWDIKVYNGAVLQAHYDMNSGNVQDQSGKGNHATLTGGTWGSA